MKPILIAITIALLATPALSQVYRSVDENGNVQYTQVPPTDTEYEAARPPPKVSDSPNQDALNQSLESALEERPEKQAEAEAAEQDRVAKQQRCDQARKQLATLATVPAQRLLKTDEQGNVSRATEADVQKRRAEYERSASENCS